MSEHSLTAAPGPWRCVQVAPASPVANITGDPCWPVMTAWSASKYSGWYTWQLQLGSALTVQVAPPSRVVRTVRAGQVIASHPAVGDLKATSEAGAYMVDWQAAFPGLLVARLSCKPHSAVEYNVTASTMAPG